MRSLILLVALAAWLVLASAVVAQSDPQAAPGDQSTDQPGEQPAAQSGEQPADQPPPGPTLQASDNAPLICDPAASGFRYVEVRGSGFDAWATQRLVGNLLDGSGRAQAQWGSVWVSPQGGLTLEVNLCADPFRGRPALPAGTYTVAVGAGSGAPIAATSIDVSTPPEPPADVEIQAPDTGAPASTTTTTTTNAAPAPTSAPYVLPNVASAPVPTPFTVAALAAPTPTPGPRAGPGSLQQPLPLGAPGILADGWQLVVTGVTPDAWTGIHDSIPSSIAPATDQRDFVVRVQATYQGQGTGVFSSMRLALVSGIQTTYDQLRNNCGIVPDMIAPNLVTTGGVVRGNICFTVRVSDIGSLVLVDNQPSDSDKLYFALK